MTENEAFAAHGISVAEQTPIKARLERLRDRYLSRANFAEIKDTQSMWRAKAANVTIALLVIEQLEREGL